MIFIRLDQLSSGARASAIVNGHEYRASGRSALTDLAWKLIEHGVPEQNVRIRRPDGGLEPHRSLVALAQGAAG